jgi:hypothetical protein
MDFLLFFILNHTPSDPVGLAGKNYLATVLSTRYVCSPATMHHSCSRTSLLCQFVVSVSLFCPFLVSLRLLSCIRGLAELG